MENVWVMVMPILLWKKMQIMQMENLDQTKFKDNIISVTHFTPKEKRMENLNNNQIMIPILVVLKIPNDMDSE